MTVKRKTIVNLLATVAFIALFLLPLLGFFANEINAGETVEAASSSGDYVFFVVSNDDVPLAAAPSTDVSSYIMWIALSAAALTIFFIYSTWYFSIRNTVKELSYKFSPAQRRAMNVSQSFFHPIRSYRLAKETEDNVASMYINM